MWPLLSRGPAGDGAGRIPSRASAGAGRFPNWALAQTPQHPPNLDLHPLAHVGTTWVQVLESQDSDGNRVVREQLLGPRKTTLLYAKHMAKQRLGITERQLFTGARHVLLVRWMAQGWLWWWGGFVGWSAGGWSGAGPGEVAAPAAGAIWVLQ